MIYRSWLRFALEGLEGTVVLLLVMCSWPLSKRWLKNWGSRAEERDRAWPGDQFVSAEHETCTRAIDVASPTRDVWPWLLQFGLGRAGFYSYELLERLVGIPVKNVESIVPSLQSLLVGDQIRLHPKAPGIPVGALKTERYICFGASDDAPRPTSEPARSFSIYLEPQGADACRLILRGCIEPPREASWLKRAALALEASIDFVMEQRMLRTIKRLSESRRARIQKTEIAYPALAIGIPFVVLYRLSLWAYTERAPGVPDHGMVPIPVMPTMMWVWGVAYDSAALLTLWFLSFLAFALPAGIGVFMARDRHIAVAAWLTLAAIFAYTAAVVLIWAAHESRFLALINATEWSWWHAVSLFGWSFKHVATAFIAGGVAGALLRKLLPFEA